MVSRQGFAVQNMNRQEIHADHRGQEYTVAKDRPIQMRKGHPARKQQDCNERRHENGAVLAIKRMPRGHRDVLIFLEAIENAIRHVNQPDRQGGDCSCYRSNIYVQNFAEEKLPRNGDEGCVQT